MALANPLDSEGARPFESEGTLAAHHSDCEGKLAAHHSNSDAKLFDSDGELAAHSFDIGHELRGKDERFLPVEGELANDRDLQEWKAKYEVRGEDGRFLPIPGGFTNEQDFTEWKTRMENVMDFGPLHLSGQIQDDEPVSDSYDGMEEDRLQWLEQQRNSKPDEVSESEDTMEEDAHQWTLVQHGKSQPGKEERKSTEQWWSQIKAGIIEKRLMWQHMEEAAHQLKPTQR